MENKTKNEGPVTKADFHFTAGARSMKCSVLFLALLLSACASYNKPGSAIGSATGTGAEHRKSDAELQPVAPEPPASVEAQPAARQPPVSVEAQPAARKPPVPVETQPAAPQPPVSVEEQQPARSDQTDLPSKKHNVEED